MTGRKPADAPLGQYRRCVGLSASIICLAIAPTVADGSAPEELSNGLDFRLDFSSSALPHPGMFQDEVTAEKPAPSTDSDAAAEMARKLQDPLANIKAVMTDNDILFWDGR